MTEMLGMEEHGIFFLSVDATELGLNRLLIVDEIVQEQRSWQHEERPRYYQRFRVRGTFFHKGSQSFRESWGRESPLIILLNHTASSVVFPSGFYTCNV